MFTKHAITECISNTAARMKTGYHRHICMTQSAQWMMISEEKAITKNKLKIFVMLMSLLSYQLASIFELKITTTTQPNTLGIEI